MSDTDRPVLTSISQVKRDLKSELTYVPDWDFRVWVWGLTAAEADRYRLPMFQVNPKTNKLKLDMTAQNIRLAAHAMRVPGGAPMFPDIQKGIEELGELSSAGVEVVAKVARRLSGMSDESESDVEGNSGAGQTGSSPSASVEPWEA